MFSGSKDFAVVFADAPTVFVTAKSRSATRYRAWHESGAANADIPYLDFAKGVKSIRRIESRPPTRKEIAEKAVLDWNESYPVGTKVLFWPGVRQGAGRVSKTCSQAWTLGYQEAVVMVTGYPGGIALSHIEPIIEEE